MVNAVVVGLSGICTDRNQKAQKFGMVQRFEFTSTMSLTGNGWN